MPQALAGQATVEGVVRDSASGLLLPQVEVFAEGAPGSVTTDTLGRYHLSLPRRDHRLVVRRIGYRPLLLQVDLTDTDQLQLDVALAPMPQSLPPLTTTESGGTPWLREFDERRSLGYGHFLDEDLLRRSEHRTLADLLRSHVPGVRLAPSGTRIVALGRGWCPMAIWVDGLRIYAPSAQASSPFSQARDQPPPDLNEWGITDLQAVEVYSLSETPIQFHLTGSGCGTIVLWTRRR